MINNLEGKEMEQLYTIVLSIGMVIIAIGILYLAVLYTNNRVKNIFDANKELVEENNLALAFRRSGLILGICLVLSSLMGFDYEVSNMLSNVRDGLLAVIFIFIALIIADKILISDLNNDQEIKNKNIGLALIEFGIIIATSLIAIGSFRGEGIWYSSIIYFVLGQFVLVLAVKLYTSKILKIDKYTGNLEQGILISSILISLGLILKTSVEGPFIDWTTDLISFFSWAVFGIVVLVLFSNKIIDKLFLPTSTINQEIQDENYAAMLVVASIRISMAILISYLVII